MPRRRGIRIEPGESFGRLVYDAMVSRRTGEGNLWDLLDLADAVGVSRNTARAWVAGDAVPGGRELARLCQVVELDAAEVCRRLVERGDGTAISARRAPKSAKPGREERGDGRERRVVERGPSS